MKISESKCKFHILALIFLYVSNGLFCSANRCVRQALRKELKVHNYI